MYATRTHNATGTKVPVPVPLLERSVTQEVLDGELDALLDMYDLPIPKGSRKGLQGRMRSIGGDRCGL